MNESAKVVLAAKLGLMMVLLECPFAGAAEIKVIGSTGVASVVDALGRQFEAATGPGATGLGQKKF